MRGFLAINLVPQDRRQQQKWTLAHPNFFSDIASGSPVGVKCQCFRVADPTAPCCLPLPEASAPELSPSQPTPSNPLDLDPKAPPYPIFEDDFYLGYWCWV